MAAMTDKCMEAWPVAEVRPLAFNEIGQRYRRYRLPVPSAEQVMARSLRRFGQISPIVVCLREQSPELVDGFTRLAAARTLKGIKTLSARLIEADERAAKAAIYALLSLGLS